MRGALRWFAAGKRCLPPVTDSRRRLRRQCFESRAVVAATASAQVLRAQAWCEVLGGGRSGLVRHDQGAGGGAERDAFAFEGLEDAAAELAQDAVALVGPDADVDRVDRPRGR